MICSRSDCQKEFEPKTHNQKYCSDECCRIATNKRIMEKYYEKKAIKSGTARYCSTRGCKGKLSRYNYSNMCSKCKMSKQSKSKKELLEMIDVASRTKKD